MSGGSEPTESEPKLRHEFVGMMFAVAIGEVGLQVAALVKQSNSLHERFASYIHLLLATTIIATSWVGWTRSVAPRAKKDVTGIFQIPFLVLLVDVALVICYFVIVRSVELPTPADTLGATVRWVRNVFVLFLLWDVLTKLEVGPFHLKFVRPAIPTILCVCLAYFAVSRISPGDSASQAVVADGALLALVLLFRAGKEVIYSFWPPIPPTSTNLPSARASRSPWSSPASCSSSRFSCSCIGPNPAPCPASSRIFPGSRALLQGCRRDRDAATANGAAIVLDFRNHQMSWL